MGIRKYKGTLSLIKALSDHHPGVQARSKNRAQHDEHGDRPARSAMAVNVTRGKAVSRRLFKRCPEVLD